MTEFPDLDDYFDPDLHLKWRGKRYTIPCESAQTGLRIRQIIAAGGFTLEDENSEAIKLLGATWHTEIVKVPVFDGPKQQFDTTTGEPLMADAEIGHWEGGVYQQMADGGVPMDVIMHAATTALTKVAYGTERAEEFWTQALNNRAAVDPGKADPPPTGVNRATRRAAAKKAPAKKAPVKKAPPRKKTAKQPSS